MICFLKIFFFKCPGKAKVRFRFADLIEQHNDELVALEAWDSGKPYEQAAKVEVPMVARQIRYYAGKSIDIVHLLHYIF